MELSFISQNIKYKTSRACCVLTMAFVPAEFQVCIGRLEAELRERSAQVDALTAQLEETQAEKKQLVEQVASINSLLEASQTKKEEDNNQVGHIVGLTFLKWPDV